MFCFNEFAFTVEVKHKINSTQILGLILICLYFTTRHFHTCVLCKECSRYLPFLILGSVFSDCVVFYGDKYMSDERQRMSGTNRPTALFWHPRVCCTTGHGPTLVWLIDRLLLQVHGFGIVFIQNYVLRPELGPTCEMKGHLFLFRRLRLVTCVFVQSTGYKYSSDTTRDGILMCAQKLTKVNLIYHTAQKTKKWKT